MTHRNVELQVALPKITEVSRLQQQMQQQHSNNHADFEKVIQQKVDLDLSRPDSPDEERPVLADKEQGQSSQQQKRERRQQPQSPPQAETPHPYKGKHVDLRG